MYEKYMKTITFSLVRRLPAPLLLSLALFLSFSQISFLSLFRTFFFNIKNVEYLRLKEISIFFPLYVIKAFYILVNIYVKRRSNFDQNRCGQQVWVEKIFNECKYIKFYKKFTKDSNYLLFFFLLNFFPTIFFYFNFLIY